MWLAPKGSQFKHVSMSRKLFLAVFTTQVSVCCVILFSNLFDPKCHQFKYH